MFNPNPAFLLVQKLKSAPLGVKADVEKKTFQSIPRYEWMLNIVASYWTQGWKKEGHQIWEANLQPQNAQSWAQVFLGPDS